MSIYRLVIYVNLLLFTYYMLEEKEVINMYYYGGYSSGYGNNYGNSCGCSSYNSYPSYGYGGGYGYGAAIILVLFILLVIIIGTRVTV